MSKLKPFLRRQPAIVTPEVEALTGQAALVAVGVLTLGVLVWSLL